MKAVFAIMLALTMIGCDAPEQKDFSLTIEGIKSLDSSISSVGLTPQNATQDTYFVELVIKKDPFTGGAQDWNSISSEVYRFGKTLFEKPEIVRISIIFRSPENNNFEWAKVFIQRDKLPNNWQSLTYLEFFSFSDPIPGNIQAGKWLREFYEKYESSKPMVSDSLTLEEKLVLLDSDYGVIKSEHTPKEYSHLLNNLTSQFEGTREEIADQSSRAQGVLRQDGIKIPILNIMRDMNQKKPAKIKVPYKDALILYIMIKRGKAQ